MCVFREIAKKFDIPEGDFPSLDKFKVALETEKIQDYPKLSSKKIAAVDEALSSKIPLIVRRLNERISQAQQAEAVPEASINPFSSEALASEWVSLHSVCNATNVCNYDRL